MISRYQLLSVHTKANGISLHAEVSCEGHERIRRERLCRNIALPAVAIPVLSLSSTGNVVYVLKIPYRDGTTQAVFDPVDLFARLVALVLISRRRITSNIAVFIGLLFFDSRDPTKFSYSKNQ
jgi:Putative transposase